MSFANFDNITRSALWSSYNNICFYCSKTLDWDNLHIDHIIPEHFKNKTEEFEKIKIEYGLDLNFELNALYNLVPTHAKCNSRKSGELFIKQTTLYYFELTKRTQLRIKNEIEKLKNRQNKGRIISKLQAALAASLIDIKELDGLLYKVKSDNWKNVEIKLPLGVEFVDEIYDLFYLNADCSGLYDKKLLLGGVFESLELVGDSEKTIIVSTLREWKEATKLGFYPLTTFAIKMSFHFTFLEDLLDALHTAKMPKISFISEPWLELDNLDFLSPNILPDFEGKLLKYSKKGFSIGALVKKGIITINQNELFKISLEFEGMETSFIEQFRADFNGDGIEDIFVKGWTRAIDGTLGVGFTSVLTRYSSKHLIDKVK